MTNAKNNRSIITNALFVIFKMIVHKLFKRYFYNQFAMKLTSIVVSSKVNKLPSKAVSEQCIKADRKLRNSICSKRRNKCK